MKTTLKIVSFFFLLAIFSISLKAQTTLLSENFDSYSTTGELSTTQFNNWKEYTAVTTVSDWQISTVCTPASGTRCLSMNNGAATPVNCAYSLTDNGDEIAYYSNAKVNATGYTNLLLSFKWLGSGEPSGSTPFDYGMVCYSTDGVTWTNITTGGPLSNGKYLTTLTTWQQITNLAMPASLNGTQFYLGFRWINDASLGGSAFKIDDIVLTATPTCSAPAITAQPSNLSMCLNGTANFGVTATGSTLSYQWKYWNGTAFVNVSGGTPAGATYMNYNTASLNVSGISAVGTYTYNCYVSNSCGNVSSSSALLLVNTAPTPIIGTITQPTCATPTGSVMLSGLSDANWILNPGNISGNTPSTTISGLAAGTYNFTLTFLNDGCTSVPTANVVINAQPATPTAPTVGTITQPTCVLSTGSVILNGLPSGNWAINPGNVAGTGTSTTISNLATGTYNFTVTNSSGCTSVASANVVINTPPPAPSAPTVGTITQPTCVLATGSVILNGLPSTGSWTINPGNIVGTGISTTVSNLVANNTYNYTVTNSSGCTSTASANVVINAQPPTPSAPTVGTITQPTCVLATGSVMLNGLPSTGNWTINPGNIVGTGISTTVSNLVATNTYYFTVTNSLGCISVVSANVVINTQPATPSAPVVGSNTPVCAGSTLNLTASTIAGATYAWTGPNSFVSALQNPGILGVSISASGTYYVTATVNGCASSAGNIVVTINAIPTVVVTPPSSTIISGTGASLTASGADVYSWTPAYGLNTTTGATVLASPFTTTTYLVTGTTGGCSNTQTAEVTVTPASFPITVSNNLSSDGYVVNYSSPFKGDQTFNLTPGTYKFSQNNGNNNFYFTVDQNGVVSITDPSSISPLITASNSILTINGPAITILNNLSSDGYVVDNTGLFKGTQTFQAFAPGSFMFRQNNGNNHFYFTVDRNGVVSVTDPSSLSPLITASNSILTINGPTITVVNNLTAAGYVIDNFSSSFTGTQTFQAFAAPGYYIYREDNGNNNFAFAVDVNGNIVSLTPATLEGQPVTGIGTTRLVIGTPPVSSCLVLDGGYINVSGGASATPIFIVVDDPSTYGITRLAAGGHIYTEGQYDFVKWNAGTGVGDFVFPFGVAGTATDYIPFTFAKTSAGSSDITASTWGTNAQNFPYPGVSNVSAVTSMTASGGEDATTTAIDRFWDVRTSAPATADITFSYRGIENTTSVPADIFKVQGWNGTLWDLPIGTGNAGATTGTGIVGPITAQTNFFPFVITRASAPLQIGTSSSLSYAVLKKKLDGGYYLSTNNKIYFSYEGEYNSGTLNYKLFDNQRSAISAGVLNNPDYVFGDNRYTLDFTNSPLINGNYYTLEVTSEKNEVYLLKFKY